MEKLKVGIIGCGGIAKLRLRQTEEEKENQSPMAQIRIHISEPTVQTHVPYVLHTGDLKEEDGIVFLPLYMTMLL